MSYNLFGDEFTGMSIWDNVPYDTRWHYHALIDACSVGKRYDGILPISRALRASDVPDPSRCLAELETVGLLAVTADTARVLHIEAFLPPEGQRTENLRPRKRRNTADYRQRKCDAGDHDNHCPKETCPVKRAAKNGQGDGKVIALGDRVGNR